MSNTDTQLSQDYDPVDVSGAHMEDTGADPRNQLSSVLSEIGLKPFATWAAEKGVTVTNELAMERAEFRLAQATKYQNVDRDTLGTQTPIYLSDGSSQLVVIEVRDNGKRDSKGKPVVYSWPGHQQHPWLVVQRTTAGRTPVMFNGTQRTSPDGNLMWYNNWTPVLVAEFADLNDIEDLFRRISGAQRAVAEDVDSLFTDESTFESAYDEEAAAAEQARAEVDDIFSE